ncbi:hypothetical protein BDZ94DRAFT_1254221 [Collybia nuda]|uniref:Uncharacterized protein n=1 Tax=Collybia nuda TaxID=64659 RepID=A0A9P6CGP6_9AGAR|nr:hypothetical protein BDZ94DRAFT_1254221 [Collybia nuda]
MLLASLLPVSIFCGVFQLAVVINFGLDVSGILSWDLISCYHQWIRVLGGKIQSIEEN